MPDMDIRELEFDDLAQVFALGERLFTADRYPALYRTWEEYELVEFFLTDGDTSFVAEIDDRIVGFALGTVIQKRRSAWTYGYLMWLGVDPDFSRQGIATRLVRRLKEAFIEEGARMIMVDTAADNTKALAFFEEMGFGSLQEHVYLSLNLTGDRTYKRLRRQGRSSHALVTQRMSLSTPPAPDPRPVPPPVLSENSHEN
jgi:ribosomal protein S18 acetylase RimI-like enzyme